jgi:hypothetical protein
MGFSWGFHVCDMEMAIQKLPVSAIIYRIIHTEQESFENVTSRT